MTFHTCKECYGKFHEHELVRQMCVKCLEYFPALRDTSQSAKGGEHGK